ncbi:MAG TPA: XRE family transcriptional regulator, partial [Burkholderiales bacterium]|nr:XRE family transcriptional regulator [Burkholderiales bacterium]
MPKSALAKIIANIIEERELTQLEAAFIVRDAPSQISLVVTGKLTGVSNERLLRMLVMLGRDIEIITRKAKGK